MKLFYFKDPVGNFGDDLNLWLWPKILPGILDEDVSSLFLGIGTLINENAPAEPVKAVLGAGVGYGHLESAIDSKWQIYFVRGPLSALALNLPLEKGVTDGAALVRSVGVQKKGEGEKISFMAHRRSAEAGPWSVACKEAGIHYIDPRNGVEKVLEDIRTSKLLITEALHGAIVADCLRVPWVAVKGYKHILEFKWMDWCQSVDLAYSPKEVHSLVSVQYYSDISKWYYGWEKSLAGRVHLALLKHSGMLWSRISGVFQMERVVRDLRRLSSMEGSLSSDRVLDEVVDRAMEKVEEFRRDVSSGMFRNSKGASV